MHVKSILDVVEEEEEEAVFYCRSYIFSGPPSVGQDRSSSP